MYIQIYYNYNSNGEDLLQLKNFCETKKAYVNTLHSKNLGDTNNIQNVLKFKTKHLSNIILVWSKDSTIESFEAIKSFCSENFINFKYLYSIQNAFINSQIPHISVSKENKTLLYSQLQKTQDTQFCELYSNLSSKLCNRRELAGVQQNKQSRDMLEL